MASKHKAGQIALTGSAQKLTAIQQAAPGCETLVLRNLSPTNVMYLGHDNSVAAGTGFRIAAGEAITMDTINPGSFWVIGTAADVLAYLALQT